MPATTVVNPRKVIAIDDNRRSRQTVRSAVGSRGVDDLVQLAVVKPHDIAGRTSIHHDMPWAVVPVGGHFLAAFRTHPGPAYLRRIDRRWRRRRSLRPRA